jgi:hypothetical protein
MNGLRIQERKYEDMYESKLEPKKLNTTPQNHNQIIT